MGATITVKAAVLKTVIAKAVYLS